MEEQIQDAASQMIGKYGWMFISGMLFLLFKSSMESMIAGFKVFIGDALNTDDVVTIEHANGKFEDICKLMNDACNAFPKEGRLVSVIDLGFGKTEILGGSNPASITSIEYAPEGGAAGMAT